MAFATLAVVVNDDVDDDATEVLVFTVSDVNESNRCHFELFCKTVFI